MTAPFMLFGLEMEKSAKYKAMAKKTTIISQVLLSQNVLNHKMKFQNGNKQKSIPNGIEKFLNKKI